VAGQASAFPGRVNLPNPYLRRGIAEGQARVILAELEVVCMRRSNPVGLD
jgi:hypothetical protein